MRTAGIRGKKRIINYRLIIKHLPHLNYYDKGYNGSVFQKGSCSIFSKSTQKELIRIESDEFSIDFGIDDFGSTQTEFFFTSYDDQNLIIHQYFDFEGDKDLVIKDGQFS